MNFANVKVVGVESNYHQRLFLEAWHSTVDPNAGNDHIVLPQRHNASMNYMILTRSLKTRIAEHKKPGQWQISITCFQRHYVSLGTQ